MDITAQTTPVAVTRIVVIGGGYAGTMAANRLAGQAGTDVVLLNARPHFVDRIRLHQWAADTGSAGHEYSTLLGDGVRLVVGTAERIDTARRRVVLASGDELPYDRLVYAVGSTARIPTGLVRPDAAGSEHAFTVGEWESAQRLREHLKTERGAVTVVGGGLTGAETAAELAERGLSVRLVCDGPLVPAFGDRGRRATARGLDRLGVRVFENLRVTAIGPRSISVAGANGDEEWPSATTIVAAGFAVPRLAADSGLTTDPDGRLVTDETLTSVDDPRIVGAGDAVAPSNTPLRMSCQAANPMGLHAADTVIAAMNNRPAQPIRIGFSGQNLSLGRRAAVIQLSHTDDTPRSLVLRGRIAGAIKEQVCRFVIRGIGLEARRPGLMRGVSRNPRTADELAQTVLR